MVLSLLLGGCASPRERYLELAYEHGVIPLELPGEGFNHQAFFSPGDQGGLLHVYLDGDGSPWATPRRVAMNPGPRDPLVLRLMLRDDAPSLYLGRPCYLLRGETMTDDCHPELWTSRRYSERVVASMIRALKAYLARHDFAGVNLIGFSGGGTLAMLMAPRLSQVRVVLTLAGNLDPDAWTRHHGYLPLAGSLNPREQRPLPDHIDQLHLVGSEDANILPAVSGWVVEVIPGIDHNCCWLELWPEILERLTRMEQQ